MDLTIISVLFGGVLLSAVVFKYLQKEAVTSVTLTCFLTLFGFALVASPAWTNISWKSKSTEFQLVRETTQQMDNYVRILQRYDDISRINARWEDPNTPQVSFVSLAKELRDQKSKIELALTDGDLEQAIKETISGTKLIETIANAIDGP